MEPVTAPDPLPANIATVVRLIFAGVAAVLVQKGVIKGTADTSVYLGYVLAIFTVLWGLYKNYNAHKALKAAIAAPNAAQVASAQPSLFKT